MARIGYRLRTMLVLLMLSAVILIQYAFLVRLQSSSLVEHSRDNWLGIVKPPVTAANIPVEEKKASSGVSSRLSAHSSTEEFKRLAQSTMHDTEVHTATSSFVTPVGDRGTTAELQPSHGENEAVTEGTTRVDLNGFETVWVNNELKVVKRKDLGSRVVVEKSGLTPRPLSPFEAAGGNIIFTIRTTHSYHHKRLPVLFQTWLSSTGGSKVVLVSDGPDNSIENRTRELGFEYVVAAACESGQ